MARPIGLPSIGCKILKYQTKSNVDISILAVIMFRNWPRSGPDVLYEHWCRRNVLCHNAPVAQSERATDFEVIFAIFKIHEIAAYQSFARFSVISPEVKNLPDSVQST